MRTFSSRSIFSFSVFWFSSASFPTSPCRSFVPCRSLGPPVKRPLYREPKRRRAPVVMGGTVRYDLHVSVIPWNKFSNPRQEMLRTAETVGTGPVDVNRPSRTRTPRLPGWFHRQKDRQVVSLRAAPAQVEGCLATSQLLSLLLQDLKQGRSTRLHLLG